MSKSVKKSSTTKTKESLGAIVAAYQTVCAPSSFGDLIAMLDEDRRFTPAWDALVESYRRERQLAPATSSAEEAALRAELSEEGLRRYHDLTEDADCAALAREDAAFQVGIAIGRVLGGAR